MLLLSVQCEIPRNRFGCAGTRSGRPPELSEEKINGVSEDALRRTEISSQVIAAK